MDVLDRLIRDFADADATAVVGVIDDLENAEKLLFNELGTRTAPARPTLTPAFEQVDPLAIVARGVDDLIAGRGSGVSVVSAAGEAIAAKTIDNINSNTPPALAESTKASRRARGNNSDATLVDTGDMRAAIRSVAKRGAEEWPDR